jgi:hypothetical protein
VQEDGDFGIFALPEATNGGSLSSASVPTQIATFSYGAQYGYGGSLAIDEQTSNSSSPDFWLADENSSYLGALIHFPALSNSPLQTITTGLGSQASVAVDNAGLVYAGILQSSTGEFVTLSAPSYVAGSPVAIPATAPFQINIAVAPAAGVLGNNSNGGSPAPLTTATPAVGAVHRP